MPEAPGITLGTPLTMLPGIGPRRAAAMAELGLTNLGKLIAYLPMRHERLAAETTIERLVAGQIVSARGEVSATRVVFRGRRPRFEAVLVDPTGRLDLVFFNQTYLRDKIHPGMKLRVQGTAKRVGPGLQLANPKWHIIAGDEEPEATEDRIRPVYPATEAVPSRMIEGAIAAAMPVALPLLEDHLSPEYRKKRELPALADAYRMMHAPAHESEVKSARRRLAYDELLLLQLGVHIKRAQLRELSRSPALRWSAQVDTHIRERIPFTLTPSQDQVVRDLVKDLSSEVPTNRLIQGDVGAGKTAVALYAMLMAVASEQQAAMMAPTEILAEQHYSSISAMLKGSKVRVELLTGATPAGERAAILERCAAGDVDIVVGTHALLTETVRFRSLAVAIIDEQHRFGVHQRARLRSKGTEEEGVKGGKGGEGRERGRAVTPHVLVMTATPIPRTLAITLFGDLDISVISGLPPGRQPVATRVVGYDKRPEVYAWVRTRLDRGEQAYIVAPAIGAGGDADFRPLAAAEEDRESEEEAAGPETGEGAAGPAGPTVTVRELIRELEAGPLEGKRLAVLHGRLSRTTRESIMERFRAGQIDALVATTVIEVGVDVPNSTTMIVENADRFGLAQLHQLRGRVGRGEKRSACVLIGPPGDAITPEAQQRLDTAAATSDGFVLAERDMEIRGPGVLFGIRQSGLAPFKVADLSRDLSLLKMARRDAAAWVEASPGLSAPNEALIRRRLVKAHGQWIGLGDVG